MLVMHWLRYHHLNEKAPQAIPTYDTRKANPTNAAKRSLILWASRQPSLRDPQRWCTLRLSKTVGRLAVGGIKKQTWDVANWKSWEFRDMSGEKSTLHLLECKNRTHFQSSSSSVATRRKTCRVRYGRSTEVWKTSLSATTETCSKETQPLQPRFNRFKVQSWENNVCICIYRYTPLLVHFQGGQLLPSLLHQSYNYLWQTWDGSVW